MSALACRRRGASVQRRVRLWVSADQRCACVTPSYPFGRRACCGRRRGEGGGGIWARRSMFTACRGVFLSVNIKSVEGVGRPWRKPAVATLFARHLSCSEYILWRAHASVVFLRYSASCAVGGAGRLLFRRLLPAVCCRRTASVSQNTWHAAYSGCCPHHICPAGGAF